MRLQLPLMAILTYTFATGCAVQLEFASTAEDQNAKAFNPPKDKAALYVYRDQLIKGGAIPLPVSINGITIGDTGPRSYFYLELVPGEYVLTSHGEGATSINLVMDKEKNYFIWQEVQMGSTSARSRLQSVGEETGRAGVLLSDLIQTDIPRSSIQPLDNKKATNIKASERLKMLKNLRDQNLITDDEYKSKKSKILKDI